VLAWLQLSVPVLLNLTREQEGVTTGIQLLLNYEQHPLLNPILKASGT
jgi:hypothetical protein